jgi:antitoxin component YwqK of YwqJK toxin-antitoxin module
MNTRYSKLTLAFLLLILVVPQVDADEPPENGKEVTVWSDSSGKFKIEASFVDLVDDNLVLLKRLSDGKIIKIPLSKLSEESKSQAARLHYSPNDQAGDPAIEMPPKNGPHVKYYENGKKKSEEHYKNGEKNGLATAWNKNGQKMSEGQFKGGKQEGLVTSWYDNGQKALDCHYKNGKRDGLWTEWHENGQKKWEKHFKDGKKDGLQTDWDENGKKTSEIHYKNGKEVSRKEF